MSALSTAALTTDILNNITNQTATEAIDPAVLGVRLQNIVDSMYNTVDGIYVTGMTVTIPGAANGMTLPEVLSIIQALLNSISTGEMNPYLFRASKTETQELPLASGSYRLVFEDDSTAPNSDASNQFNTDKFVAKTAGTYNFSVEQVKVTQTTSGTDTYRVRILKNGTEIETSSTITANSTVDSYGNTAVSGGYVFNSVVAKAVAVVAGDEITSEVVRVAGSATAVIVNQGIFSNS